MVHPEASSTLLPTLHANIGSFVSQLIIIKTLRATGATLVIDRVKQQSVQQDFTNLQKDFYGDLRRNLFRGYDWQPPGMTGNVYEGEEETELDYICDVFIPLRRSAAYQP